LNVINRMERGVITDPHSSTLAKLAQALEVSVGELLEEERPLVPARA
jgi:transcriptional regulator with XRE-family HTH domain